MDIVILGAGYAGLACALRLDRRLRGRANITLVSASDRFVDRIRLHQRAAGQLAPAPKLADMVRSTELRFVEGWVEAIDPRGSIRLDRGRLPFDRLVIALGSSTDVSAFPGIREHAFTLEPGSVEALANALPALSAHGKHLVVIGGGLSGIESAAELKESYPRLRITLLSRGALGPGLSGAGRIHLLGALERLGVTVEENAEVQKITDRGIHLAGRILQADAQLFAGGFLAPALLGESGLTVNGRGQALVDASLRAVGQENIHVIGDAGVMQAPPYPMIMGCKTALPMGIHAAESLARAQDGLPEEPFDYADTVLCISLGRRDGLIQPMRKDGRPTRWILRGRVGAWIKEGICRGVPWVLEAERRGHAVFNWRRTGRPKLEAAENRKALPA